MPRKKNSLSASVHDLPQQAGMMPDWMAKMRAAAVSKITEEDIEDIVVGQVKRAKEGNPAAIKFVFEQVLGGAAFKGATLHQHVTNHHYGNATPGKATEALPGSEDRIDTMAARVAQGESIFNDDDGEPDLE